MVGWNRTKPIFQCARGTFIATLRLRDIEFEVRLSGWKAAVEEADVIVGPKKFISVQCGDGMRLNSDGLESLKKHQNMQTCMDLSAYTSFCTMRPSSGHIHHLVWVHLLEKFEELYQEIQHAKPKGRVLWFWCKLGKNRSYAMLVMFLMWMMRIHQHDVWESLIAPVRNKDLNDGETCDLNHWSDLTAHQRNQMKKNVLFGDVIDEFTMYLETVQVGIKILMSGTAPGVE